MAQIETEARILEPAEVRALIRYEPEAGQFFWLSRPRELFSTQRSHKTWNARYAGKQVWLRADHKGYMRLGIFKKFYRAHRVAWAITHGEWPELAIDHINSDKADNRISNLRLATRAQNSMNRGPLANNKSGLKGVTQDVNTRRWRAIIKVDGRARHLGMFSTKEDAYAAYCAAVPQFHGEFGRVA